MSGIKSILPIFKKAIQLEMDTDIGRVNALFFVFVCIVCLVILFTGFSIGGDWEGQKFKFYLGDSPSISKILIIISAVIGSGLSCVFMLYKADQKKILAPGNYKKKRK